MLTVQAHLGKPIAPHDLLTSWNLDPLLIVILAATGWAYFRGSHTEPHTAAADRRHKAFYAGMGVIALALISPLEAVSGVLVSAHMVQHILLIMVAGPLLGASASFETILRGLPPRLRKRSGAWRRAARLTPSRFDLVRRPALVLLLYAGTLWFWHGSVVYQTAARHRAVHIVQHLLFLGTALLFWSAIFSRRPANRMSRGSAVLLVFAAAMQGVLLSALMTFTSRPWYPEYGLTSLRWGLDPISDQRLAGLIMWIPGGLVYTAVALGLVVVWIREAESSRLESSR